MTVEQEMKDAHAPIRKRLWNSPVPPPKSGMIVKIVDVAARSAPPVRNREPERISLDALLDDPEEMDWRHKVISILVRYREDIRRLRSDNRDRNIVACRREIARELRKRAWSFPRIGEFMHRDHSSIVHLVDPEPRKNRHRERALESLAKKNGL